MDDIAKLVEGRHAGDIIAVTVPIGKYPTLYDLAYLLVDINLLNTEMSMLIRGEVEALLDPYKARHKYSPYKKSFRVIYAETGSLELAGVAIGIIGIFLALVGIARSDNGSDEILRRLDAQDNRMDELIQLVQQDLSLQKKAKEGLARKSEHMPSEITPDVISELACTCRHDHALMRRAIEIQIAEVQRRTGYKLAPNSQAFHDVVERVMDEFEAWPRDMNADRDTKAACVNTICATLARLSKTTVDLQA